MSREDIFLREISWNFILAQKIKFLPISSSAIALKNGYKLLTYNEFSMAINKPIKYVIDKYDNDGFVFWSNKEHQFIICYNSDLPYPVIRWTIMHEIAHIILRHVTNKNPALTRIRKIEHPQFEKEADGFTRRVLCPSIVLHDCKSFEVEEIMQLCGITKTAAEYRSDYIKKLEIRNKWRTDPLEIAVENQFKLFVLKYWRNKTMFEIAKEIAA